MLPSTAVDFMSEKLNVLKNLVNFGFIVESYLSSMVIWNLQVAPVRALEQLLE